MREELIFKENINVTRPKMPEFESYSDLIKGIWDRRWLTNNGPLHERFKEELCQYLGLNNIELFVNGHLALETALKSLELEGEVITTPFTFVSTIHAITNCGLKPIFCDIEMDYYNIDYKKIEELITEKTTAIVAVHVFGNPCAVKEIEEIAKKHNLKVIYDAAHAFAVEINGQPIGSFGDISMFSFHATKVFNSIEGGMLSFSDSNIKSKLMSLKNFGITSPESIGYVGTNAKMNEFQSAMGLCNLKTIEEDIKHRKLIFDEYINNLQDIDGIKLLKEIDGVKHNYSYFPIILTEDGMRNYIHQVLKKYNVISRKYFYPLCNAIDCYDFDESKTPNAIYISERVLSLPIYSDLKLEDVRQICDIIKYEIGDINEKQL